MIKIIDTVATYFHKENWITPELQNEIEKHYPTDSKWTTDPNTGVIKYS